MPEKNSTINGIQPAAADKSVSPSVAPKCRTLIRATKEVRVRCDVCSELFRKREELEREKVGIYASHRRKW